MEEGEKEFEACLQKFAAELGTGPDRRQLINDGGYVEGQMIFAALQITSKGFFKRIDHMAKQWAEINGGMLEAQRTNGTALVEKLAEISKTQAEGTKKLIDANDEAIRDLMEANEQNARVLVHELETFKEKSDATANRLVLVTGWLTGATVAVAVATIILALIDFWHTK
jgi:hypothetical protein